MAESEEEKFVTSLRGKWSKAGVPHRGWVCVDIEDLGEPQDECEMCESQTIRYVHHMKHNDYPKTLSVGCVCAGNMEGDLSAARKREASMQSRSAKRKRWTTRKWKISQNGNPTINSDGYRVTVYRRSGKWAAVVSSINATYTKHSNRSYLSISQAKLAAFDHITRLITEKNG